MDASRVALWGVSYSGGHALVTAATHEHAPSVVKAVVANEPYLSSRGAMTRAVTQHGAANFARAAAAAVADQVRPVTFLWLC